MPTNKISNSYFKKMKLITDDNGHLIKCARNLRLVLKNDTELTGKIRLNTLDGRIHISEDVPWNIERLSIDGDGTGYFTDNDEAALSIIMEQKIGWCSKVHLETAYKAVALENQYNPRIDYFNSLEWDGYPRLSRLFIDFLGAEDTFYTQEVTKLVFVAAVARTFTPGTKFDLVPVLTGPQGIGKSLLTQLMSIRPEWYANDITTIDKDTHEKLIGKLIVDLSELSAMLKHPEELKDLVSSSVDVIRRAYCHHVVSYPRTCVFIASTDKDKYLNDLAGERRWFPIKCIAENKVRDASTLTEAEIAQYWAEAMAYYKGEMSIMIPQTLEDEAAKMRKQYSEIDDEAEQIREYILHLGAANVNKVCSAQIIAECLGIQQTDANKRRINSILAKKFGLERITSDFGDYGHHMRGFRIG